MCNKLPRRVSANIVDSLKVAVPAALEPNRGMGVGPVYLLVVRQQRKYTLGQFLNTDSLALSMG
ncbi:MAG: hypothetical protein CM15mP120_01660 [Pseudomonadota bacterium]|nr:MAG: hypothetical protein CM15mP120_01660 [Pseudomonadota bacterium]